MLEIITFGVLRVIRSVVDSIASTTNSVSTNTDSSDESQEYRNENDHNTDCLLGITTQCTD